MFLFECRNFYEAVKKYQHRLISQALSATGGNQAKAAKLLGLSATTLNCQIRRLGIRARAFRRRGQVVGHGEIVHHSTETLADTVCLTGEQGPPTAA